MADNSVRVEASNVSWRDKSLGVMFPSEGTGSLCEFTAGFGKINSFLIYITGYAESHAKLAKFLHGLDIPKEIKPSTPDDDAYKNFNKHRQFLFEVMLSRHVDNYLCFLSSILKECFLAKPEIMRSSKQISLKKVLNHSSMQSLVQSIAEEMVQGHFYESFIDLAETFHKYFNIKIADVSQTELIIEAIETRNISIHNRCVIDDKYCDKTGTARTMVGNVKVLQYNYITEIAKIFAASAIHSDTTLSAKYSISTTLIESYCVESGG